MSDTNTPIRSYAKRNRHLAEGFQNWLASYNKSASTRKSYGETVDFFLEFMGSDDVMAATHRTLSLFMGTLHSRGLNAYSLNRHVYGLRKFYEWLSWAGIIGQNPARLIPNRRLPSYLPRTVLNPEIEKLLEAAKRPPEERLTELRDKALIELGYGAGLRVSELVQVRTDDLDFEDGTIGRVLIRKGKGGKQRYVPFGSKAIAALKEYLAERKRPSEWLFCAIQKWAQDVWLIGSVWRGMFYVNGKPTQVTLGHSPESRRYRHYDDLVLSSEQEANAALQRIMTATPGATALGSKPLDPRSVRRILANLSKRAGIKHVNPHALRHGTATDLHNSGVDIRYITEILGHSTVGVTQHYLRSNFENVKQVYERSHPHAGGSEHE